MPQQGRLRIHGEGGVEVELVRVYLTNLTHAYDFYSAVRVSN